MINRVEEIKKKGFAIRLADSTDDNLPIKDGILDFSKIKVGTKVLEDAVINLGDLRKINPRLADKKFVLDAIHKGDLNTMREISNFYFKISGIYSRLCRYMAYLYRYDWMITPYINSESLSNEKVLSSFHKALTFLDDFEVKRFCGETALKVLRNGCYYGYLIPTANSVSIQELPVNYCRSRFEIGNKAAVEFNMKFFDDYFKDTEQRIKMLNLFPNDFKKGYILYKEGKLVPQFPGDTSGWYLLDTNNVIKFNMNGEDYPTLISVIPAIIDLDAAQELDRKRMAQKLLKIIIQKMPLDKNNDLVFDVDEMQ